MGIVQAVVLSVILAAATPGTAPSAIFVDGTRGNDVHSGTEPTRALKSFKAATAKLKPGMTLIIVRSREPYREPLILRTSGEPDRPIVIEGNGNTIDLGTDVSDGPWKAVGDEWVLEKVLVQPKDDGGLSQAASLFVDTIPLYTQSPKRSGPLQPGQVRFDERGFAHVRFPEGKRPGICRIVRPMDPMRTSVVSLQASFVTVRNLTCQYAGNDGFNLHGNHQGVRLENVKAFFNGDEGISAHDRYEAEVVGAEVAYNGSVAGGIADVNDSVTIYRNCLIHHNRAPFHFDPTGRHAVRDSVVFANGRSLPAKPQANVTLDNVVSLPPGPAPDPAKYSDNVRPLVERAAGAWTP